MDYFLFSETNYRKDNKYSKYSIMNASNSMRLIYIDGVESESL